MNRACPPCSSTCRQGRDCPEATEPGLLISPAFWAGLALSVIAWTLVAFSAAAVISWSH